MMLSHSFLEICKMKCKQKCGTSEIVIHGCERFLYDFDLLPVLSRVLLNKLLANITVGKYLFVVILNDHISL